MIAGAISPENTEWFSRSAERYASESAAFLKESCSLKAERSLQKLVDQAGTREATDRWLTACRERWSRRDSVLPTPEELHGELIAELAHVREAWPFLTTNLSVSRPAALADAICLNVIVRLYDRDKKQRIKIKIGSFVDQRDQLHWEVGFVDVKKSIRSPLLDLLANLEESGDYFLLGRLVDCTKRFIRRRPCVVGLDLTPAFYHVSALCLRMGGVPQDPSRLRAHLTSIEEAYDRFLAGNPGWDSVGRRRYRRWRISWLLERRQLSDPMGRPIAWGPPRLVWKPATP